MRILFLTDKFTPERGGSQIIFNHVYDHLPAHEVTVLTRSWPGDREADASYRHPVVRVPYSNIPKLRTPLLWLSLLREGRRLIRRQGFDLIVSGQPVETAPFGARLAREFHLPSLVHTFAEDVTSFLTHPILGRMMRGALTQAGAVTTISHFTRDHLLRLGVSPERIVLLYPGVVPERWQDTGRAAEIRRRYELEGKRVVITVSRLIPRKGHDVVLQALPQVLKKVPNAVYLIVGDGPQEAHLRSLADSLGLQNSVRFAGSIPNAETVDYYHASDVFVMPNRRMSNGDIEGFGLVFLEANVCGLPVIGGRSGGAVDAIEHGRTGFLVEPTSVEEVADRLIELLTQEDRAREMGTVGRQRVLDNFTWSRSGTVLDRAVTLAAGRA